MSYYLRLINLLVLLLIVDEVKSQNAPTQPMNGPGGSNYLHSDVIWTKFGTDITDCYWVIEPVNPKPDSAVVIVYWHGTTNQSNIDSVPNGQYLNVEHIVKKGYTVIFPLYQYGGNTLPPQQQITNGANVVNLALYELDNGIDRIRPMRNSLGKILLGATGVSRGGGMTMNVASYHTTLGLPSFDALCAFVPGAGQQMSGIDTSTKVLIVNGEENTINFASSQEAFDSLHHIPCINKHLIQVNSDYYGNPDLIAEHNFAGSGNDPLDDSRLNTLDYYGSWKYSVGVFECAFKNQDCEYCFGTDTLITYMGHWSDGTPVNPSAVIDTCGNIFNDLGDKLSLLKSDITIYPNPTNGKIKLISNVNLNNFKFFLYDALGNLIVETDHINDINFENLNDGIYFITAISNTHLFTKIIIKQKANW